ncbi:MAG TPA: hypothetical protein DCF45_09180 [Gammaproteobacteria bacterium]|nr:hypothetical protein [Gammaproteobacteria bacterium]
MLNLATVELEYRLRREQVIGRPYILVVDPINVCNLRCPLCSTGLLQQNRHVGRMSWQDFTNAIDQAAPWAFKVNLFNWGESLLHENIVEMIEYSRSKNLSTTLSTNLSLKLEEEKIEKLLHSGLDYLCLSIDGASQETYETYRKKGDLSLVLENIKHLVRIRDRLGLKTPVIEWQFIPMKHNEHEINVARELAESLGVDQFRCIPVGVPFDAPNRQELEVEWFPTTRSNNQIAGEEISSNEQAESSCYFLYRYLVVNPDAGVSPCCVVSGESNDFGSLRIEPLDNLVNNTPFRSARALFNKRGKPQCPTVCETCDLFKHRSCRTH